MTSVLIKTDGSFTAIDTPSNGFSLEELYKVLSCDLVEVVPVEPRPSIVRRMFAGRMQNPILICDEEGLWSKDLNHMASMIAGTNIVGDVILTDSTNFR